MICWWYEYNKFCFSFGSRVYSWCLKKQEVIAQSTAKVENETTNTTVNQAICDSNKAIATEHTPANIQAKRPKRLVKRPNYVWRLAEQNSTTIDNYVNSN